MSVVYWREKPRRNYLILLWTVGKMNFFFLKYTRTLVTYMILYRRKKSNVDFSHVRIITGMGRRSHTMNKPRKCNIFKPLKSTVWNGYDWGFYGYWRLACMKQTLKTIQTSSVVNRIIRWSLSVIIPPNNLLQVSYYIKRVLNKS